MAVGLWLSQERRKSCFPSSHSRDFTWEADSSFAQIHFLPPMTEGANGVRKILGCTPLNLRTAEALWKIVH